MRFRHVNPVGPAEVPLLGRILDRGEVFEVSDAVGARLLSQPNNYQLLDDDPAEQDGE